MNLPTKLTFLRIFLIPVFIALFFVRFPYHCVAATGIFIIASFTDFLDGYIARKRNLVTDLGKFLDPIADKMLVACALFAVVAMLYSIDTLHFSEHFYNARQIVLTIAQIGGTVCAMVILCRELMISGFRIVASSKNVVLAADKLGKIKTVLQMCALILLLPVADFYNYATQHAMQLWGDGLLFAGLALLALSTVMAIASGVNYLVKNKQVLKD